MIIDKLKLRMGRSIVIDKEHDISVKQPLIKEIVDIGENEFTFMLTPFTITTEFIFDAIENEKNVIDNSIKEIPLFELYFEVIEEDKTILDLMYFNGVGGKAMEQLVNSLCYFLDTENIKVLNHVHKLVVDDKYLIDNNEFLKIRKAIQSVTSTSDIEVEKPPNNMSPRQADVWKKLQKGRRRKSERDAIYLQDIINFVAFGGKSFISNKEIDNMTRYELLNAYKSIVGIDSYYTQLQYKLSSKFDIKDKINHWIDSLKIGK